MHRFYLFFEFLFKYYYHFVLDVSKDISNIYVSNPPSLELKILTIEDLPYFKQWKGKEKYLDLYKARLLNPNYYCFAMIDTINDKLAYYSWINYLDNYYIKEINKLYYLKKHKHVLFEDDNTNEAYRGQKIHTFVMSKRIEFSKKIGAKKIIVEIYPRNKAAIITAKKFGFKRRNINPFYLRQGSVNYIINKISTYVFSHNK